MKPENLFVIDIWQTLWIVSTTAAVVFGVALVCVGLPLYAYDPELFFLPYVKEAVLAAAALPALFYGGKSWTANVPFFQIHARTQSLSFCASDVELSLVAIVTFHTFRSRWRRRVISALDVVGLDNQSQTYGSGKTRRRAFSLNISTLEGSHQLTFSSKQKRDECRARLVAYLKTMDKRPPAGTVGDLSPE